MQRVGFPVYQLPHPDETLEGAPMNRSFALLLAVMRGLAPPSSEKMQGMRMP